MTSSQICDVNKEIGNDNKQPQEVLTDDQLLRIYGKTSEKNETIVKRAKTAAQDVCSCSECKYIPSHSSSYNHLPLPFHIYHSHRKNSTVDTKVIHRSATIRRNFPRSSKITKIINSVLPISSWLPKYKIKESLVGDIAGGITVGIVHLPQGMAYSILTSLPAVNGLYVSFFPALMYALFGTTRHLSIGTFAVAAIMIGAVIDKHVPADYCGDYPESSMPDYVNINETTTTTTTLLTTEATSIDCNAENVRRRTELAIGISLAVSIIHLAMYILRLGIVTIYLSSHMVSGFTCGAAIHVLTSQVPKLLGLHIPRKSGILSVVYTYIDVFSQITSINWATVIVSVCCITLLVIGKEVNLYLQKKIPFPLPWELAVVIFSTVSSQYGYLNNNYDVSIVGEIPQGIKTSVPDFVDVGLVILDCIPIAIVIFSVSISLSRLFSEKHAYEFDANQELLAFSAANVFGSFFQCFPGAASLSRSLIWEETGGNTQLTGVVSSSLILVILLWIGQLFESLPEAALASIIVVNLKRMLKQFEHLNPLWKVSRLDAVTWFVTWLAVVLLGVDLGLYVGVGFSLFTVVLRTQIVTGNVMAPVGNTGIYKSTNHYIGETKNEILVFKFPAPIVYANKERFLSQFHTALGFNPSFEITRRKKLEKSKSKQENTNTIDEWPSKFSRSASVNPAYQNEKEQCDNDSSMQLRQLNAQELNRELEACSKPELSSNHADEDAEDFATPSHVVLDMSACSFVDNDGVKALKTACNNLLELKIKIKLARCTADVRRCLIAGEFPTNLDEDAECDPVFFLSINKAINHVNNERKDSCPSVGTGISTPKSETLIEKTKM